MRERILAVMLGVFVVSVGALGTYVQYRYMRFLSLRDKAIAHCNQGDLQSAREFISLAIDYAPDSEALASALTDRRRFRFGFCEDYSGGNF
jgi:hypothetical protein